MSLEYAIENDTQQAFSEEQVLITAAEDGQRVAQLELAFRFLLDDEHPDRFSEGFYWADKAAEESIRARLLVIRCLYDGKGCEQDKF